MGNEVSSKMLDDLPSILEDYPIKPSGGGFEGIDFGGVLAEGTAGGAAAGISVGILDGTAGSAIDVLRGKHDRGSSAWTPDPSTFPKATVPAGPIGPVGPTPEDLLDLIKHKPTQPAQPVEPIDLGPIGPVNIGDIFRDAAEESQRQEEKRTEEERKQADEKEDDEEDEPDPDDPEDIPPVEILTDDEKDEGEEDPFPPLPPIPVPPEKPKDDDDSEEDKPFIPVEINIPTTSLLRALKRIPSDNVGPDDFETEEQSKQDKQEQILRRDLRHGIYYDLDSKLSHQAYYNERMRMDTKYIETETLQELGRVEKNIELDRTWYKYITANTIPRSKIYREDLFSNNDPQYQPTDLVMYNDTPTWTREILV